MVRRWRTKAKSPALTGLSQLVPRVMRGCQLRSLRRRRSVATSPSRHGALNKRLPGSGTRSPGLVRNAVHGV